MYIEKQFEFYMQCFFGTISHPQERMTVNHDATGSSPVTGATKSHNQAVCGISSFCEVILFLRPALADLHKNLPNYLCI